MTTTVPSGSTVASETTAAPETKAAQESVWRTIRRGVALTPGLKAGLLVTVALALAATAGRLVVPLSIQLFLDHGVLADGGPNAAVVAWCAAAATAALLITATAAYGMNVRLVRVTESALARLRTLAFRHVHRLSILDQQEHRRGALVARITSDVDQISQFLQWGGLLLLASVCQVALATGLMLFYSWQLTLLVYACFVPLVLLAPRLQRRLNGAYQRVRERSGDLLASVGESVTGALVIRAYGAAPRTRARVDRNVERYANEQVRAQRLSVFISTGAEIASGLATAAVVVVGVLLGVGGDLTLGELTGFLFLITLFVAPVQLATEILNETQNAVAGWRRVLGVLDIEPAVTDAGDAGRPLPPGALSIAMSDVGFQYPTGPPVLRDVTVTIAAGSRVAIVGETGSGKTTFVKVLTRLMDPTSGRVDIGGVDVTEVSFATLRERVALVPQEPFLFNTTVGQNVTLGRLDAAESDLRRAFADLGLSDWLDQLPAGLDTPVGERGESLSAGERQLVAIVRAHLVDPSILVLDEATSAVDPASDVRLHRAMERLVAGRTTVTIAHRLYTAETADEILVFDGGRLTQRGGHAELVADSHGVYAKLHASWVAHAR